MKNNKVLIIVMSIIIIMLIGLCSFLGYKLYNKPINEPKEEIECPKEEKLDCKDIEGFYEFSEVSDITSNGTDYFDYYAKLQLNEDKTFVYEIGIMASVTYFGNYYINDNNQIVLNILFYNPTTGADIEGKHMTIVLEVDENKNLIDKNKETASGSSNKEINLQKSKVTQENKTYDFYQNVLDVINCYLGKNC